MVQTALGGIAVTDRTHDDDAPDLASADALIAEQRARVAAATDVDGRLLFGAWGVAWTLGYTVQWLADRGVLPLSFGAALGVFFALLAAAGVVTAVHLVRQSTGVRGATAIQGAVYGWCWALASVGIAALGVGLGRADADPAVVRHVMTVVPVLVVGVLFMAGGALWQDRRQVVLGGVVAVAAVAGALVGLPTALLVMAVVGGGGMLTAAALHHRGRGLPGVAGQAP